MIVSAVIPSIIGSDAIVGLVADPNLKLANNGA